VTVEQYKNSVQVFGIENNEAEIFNEYRCVHPGSQAQAVWNERIHFRCRVGWLSVAMSTCTCMRNHIGSSLSRYHGLSIVSCEKCYVY